MKIETMHLNLNIKNPQRQEVWVGYSWYIGKMYLQKVVRQ